MQGGATIYAARYVAWKYWDTTGLCREVHDLAVSKYVVGRERDLQFTRELARHGLTDEKALLKRLTKTTVNSAVRKIVSGRIRSDSRGRKTSSP
jgi:hypothetical protein